MDDVIKLELSNADLTPAEREQVSCLVEQIDFSSSKTLTSYGSVLQKKLSGFTNNVLRNATSCNTGTIGELLGGISSQIKDFNHDAEDERKFFGIFPRQKAKGEALRKQFTPTADALERIRKELDGQRAELLVDINSLENIYQQNLAYRKELAIYIMAGQQKLIGVRNGELAELARRAESTKNEEVAMMYDDLRQRCDSFEKQLHDLELTRTISLQMLAQIRLIQQTNEELVRKIQSSITQTIPLWKDSIAIALAIRRNEEAATMQREMTDLTSEMLTANAKRVRASAVAAARETERGVVDIEAVKATNDELLAAIDELIMTQEAGRRKRAKAEIELRASEENLQRKLLGSNQQ